MLELRLRGMLELAFDVVADVITFDEMLVEMESLQFVGCSWFIGLIGLVSDSPRINSSQTEMCVSVLPSRLL
jgi:hypothetical protein